MKWLVTAGIVCVSTGTTLASPSPQRAVSPTLLPRAAPPFPSSCPGAMRRYSTGVAAGWRTTKLLGGRTMPRGLAFDPLGQLVVVENGVGLTLHVFDGATGCVARSTLLVDNKGLNHGVALSPDGRALYASTMTQAYRWDYDAAAGAATNRTTIVKNMNQGGHPTRSLYLAPGHPNLLLAAVGSNANWDYEATSMATPRAVIKAFDLTKVPAGGFDYAKEGSQFGWGLRNEVGVAFDPNGMAWGVENSGDDFARTVNGVATDIHRDNPAEELNYLGDPTKPNTQWYGYPTCFTVWDGDLFKDASFKTGDQFVVTPNASFTDLSCSSRATPPRLTFQAHSAPINAVFDSAGENLYITFHGSWDRQPATGYKVVEVPFHKLADGSYDPVAPRDSKDGYKDIVFASDAASCAGGIFSNSCWRPAGLVWDPTGTRMVMSSDGSDEGELYLIAKA